MIDDRGRNRGLALEEIKWHCRLGLWTTQLAKSNLLQKKVSSVLLVGLGNLYSCRSRLSILNAMMME